MKLISSKIIRDFAPQMDLLNTIGGGVAQPQVRLDKREQGVILKVALPSASPDTFHVALHNQRLTVYGAYRHQPDDELSAPLFMRMLDLPANLDVARIDAVQHGTELRVRIPYKRTNDEPRELDIRHED
jgi:HSP20 family protein